MTLVSLFAGVGGSTGRSHYVCAECGSAFTSHNPKPKYCSAICKNRSQEAPFDIQEAISLYEAGLSQAEIGERFGVAQQTIAKAFKRHGYRARAAAKRDQRGEKNDYWRGGRTISTGGYVLVRSPDHPRADSGGYVFEHILVMEEQIGRHLEWHGPGHPGSEIVHHVNGDKQDNRPTNLALTTFEEHLELHRDPDSGQNKGGDAKCR